VPTVLFGLLIPLAVAAIALWRSESIARLVSAIPLHWLVAAQIYRVAGGIFLVLLADGRLPWQFALPAGVVGGPAGVLFCVRGCAVGTKRNWRAQGNIRLVPFRNRRPRRGSLHGGNDLSRTGASSCIRGAEPSRDVLSAGHGAHLRRSAGPDAPWPRSMAAAA